MKHEDLKQKDMKSVPDDEEIDERFTRKMDKVVERFIEDTSEIAADYGLEDVSQIYMICFTQILEHTAPSDEAIEDLAEHFSDFVSTGIENGDIEARVDEEELQERFDKMKEEIKKKEGRK